MRDWAEIRLPYASSIEKEGKEVTRETPQGFGEGGLLNAVT